MVSCFKCGAQLRDQARFCSQCGTPQTLSLPPEEAATVIASTRGDVHEANTMPSRGTNESVAVQKDISPLNEAIIEATNGSDSSIVDGTPFDLPKEDNGRDIQQIEPPAQEVAVSVPPTPFLLESPIETRKAELAEQRTTIAANLQTVIPFVEGPYLEQNRDWFERGVSLSPPIEDNLWGNIAHTIGVYGRFMWKRPLDAAQKSGMWQALIWAVKYESCFHPNKVASRFLALVYFYNGCHNDPGFANPILVDIESLVSDPDISTLIIEPDPNDNSVSLKKMEKAVSEIIPTPVIAQLLQKIETRQVIVAIERLWFLLDKNYEKTNRETIEKAGKELGTLQAKESLARLAGVICLNAVNHYAQVNGQLGGALSNVQLEEAMLLADFAAQYSTTDYYKARARRNHLLLSALSRMRSGTLEPASFAEELRERLGAKEQDKSALSAWADLIGMVMHYLAELRQANRLDPAGAEKWRQVFTGVSGLSEPDRKQFLAEVALHSVSGNGPISNDETPVQVKSEVRKLPLGFLSDDQSTRLLKSIHILDFEEMGMILQSARQSIFSALKDALADPLFKDIRPPRRSFHIRSNNRSDLFLEEKTRILSPHRDDWEKALRFFMQAVNEVADSDDLPVACEWLLFARARVEGILKVVLFWQTNFNKGVASWEEIWNLAVYSFLMKDYVQALEVLKPGVINQHAPFSHLRFALNCAVLILQQPERYSKDIVDRTVAFLLENITILPLPACYLAWLLLVNDSQEASDYKKQEPILRAFEEILDRPISILRPENIVDEDTIETFENDLKGLLSTIQMLEEKYVLELQGNKLGIRSKMVATFLRTQQVVPKRVGLFIDYENLLPLLSEGMKRKPKEVGEILLRHVSRYGNVVCSWACAARSNIPDPDGLSEELGKVGIRVQFPRGETGALFAKPNLTDFVLVERITYETTHSRPDVYIIVSGDKDYYEKIMGLLEEKKTVHLVASISGGNLASKYKKLEEKSKRSQLPESLPGDFFIDNFDEIFKGNPAKA